jgi:hypothetical protein
VYEQALRRGGKDKEAEAAEVDALRLALEWPDGPHDSKVSSIQTIIDTLPDEEWFVQVRNWRSPEFGAFDSWYRYLDGHDWQLQCCRDLPPRVTEALEPLACVRMASTSRSSAVDLGHRTPERTPSPGSNGGNGSDSVGYAGAVSH